MKHLDIITNILVQLNLYPYESLSSGSDSFYLPSDFYFS